MERGFGRILFINILYFDANAVPTKLFLSLIKKKRLQAPSATSFGVGGLPSFFLKEQQLGGGSVIYLAQNISHNSCENEKKYATLVSNLNMLRNVRDLSCHYLNLLK